MGNAGRKYELQNKQKDLRIDWTIEIVRVYNGYVCRARVYVIEIK